MDPARPEPALRDFEAAALASQLDRLNTDRREIEAAVRTEALAQADRAILFKTGVKEIGARFGIMPSFMAKPVQQLPGDPLGGAAQNGAVPGGAALVPAASVTPTPAATPPKKP